MLIRESGYFHHSYAACCVGIYRPFHRSSIALIHCFSFCESDWDLLFNVTCNDISVIYVTAHRCEGGMKRKFDPRSSSQRHSHFVGFFNVPDQTPTRSHLFCTVIPRNRHIKSPLSTLSGYGGHILDLAAPPPPLSARGIWGYAFLLFRVRSTIYTRKVRRGTCTLRYGCIYNTKCLLMQGMNHSGCCIY